MVYQVGDYWDAASNNDTGNFVNNDLDSDYYLTNGRCCANGFHFDTTDLYCKRN